MNPLPPRRSDRVAVVLLLAATVGYLAMLGLPYCHFLTSGPAGEPSWRTFRGYELWQDVLPSPRDLRDPEVLELAFSAGFLLLSLLVGACPFLVVPLSHSRVLWWAVVLVSGMAVIGLVGVLGWYLSTDRIDRQSWRPGPGLVLLLGTPLLNFAGLLFVRRADGLPPGEARGPKLPQG
jgi:hypothetical protein